MNYIIYVTDVETTGLDCKQNDIIEISFLRFYFDKPNEIEQKTWLLKAMNPATIHDDALIKNGHKKEDVLGKTEFGRDNYKNPSEILPEIEAWFAQDNHSAFERVFAGQNPWFDYEFEEELWRKNDSIDTFPFQVGHGLKILDTKEITLMIDVILNQTRESYSLSNLIKDFGIKKEKAHRADADVRMTKDLLVNLIGEFKEVAERKFRI